MASLVLFLALNQYITPQNRDPVRDLNPSELSPVEAFRLELRQLAQLRLEVLRVQDPDNQRRMLAQIEHHYLVTVKRIQMEEAMAREKLADGEKRYVRYFCDTGKLATGRTQKASVFTRGPEALELRRALGWRLQVSPR